MSKDGAGSAAGRPLRGGADRNLGERPNIFTVVGRPLRGGADRNALLAPTEYRNSRRPLRGGADRNFAPGFPIGSAGGVAPCAGARIETSSA